MASIKKFLIFIFLLFNLASANSNNWINSGTYEKVITKNVGQFSSDVIDLPIDYAYNGSKEYFYFTKEGVVFEFQNKYKPVKSEEEKAWRTERKKEGFTKEEFNDFERLGHRIVIERDYLHTTWLNANKNVEIIAQDKNTFYHSYSWVNENNREVNQNKIPSYNKLVYKNLYDNIDVIYEMHPESGIKYTLIVHPGGNINDVKLKYSKTPRLTNNGELITPSDMGDIIDHAPVTFYDKQTGSIIPSNYKLDGNIISFHVPNYDNTKTLVIDPWTQTPNYNLGWDCVWEAETDAAGNTYTIGGIMPMVLNKYDASGALVWSYNTPYDTTSWLGTFATDNLGNSYVTLGSTARIQKLSPTGAVLWNNNNPGGLFSSMEFWNIEFNCDQSKLIVGGTGGTLPPVPAIYDIDVNSGNILNTAILPNNSQTFGFPPPVEEVRAIASCNNGNYYYLTHKEMGYINDDLTLCSSTPDALFNTQSGFTLAYKCEDWRLNNSGIEAMEYYNDFIYLNRGDEIQKRRFSDASIVATVAIPNGDWSNGFGGSNVGNSGIAIDDCGNIYVGSRNRVIKYDQDLTLLDTYNTTNNFNVWDVEITSNGDLIASGGTGDANDNNRNGYVESINVNACAQIAIVCCDATMCPAGPLCETDPSFTITVATPGGTFAGPGIINANTGEFDPTTAGIGSHQISYTLPCGSDTLEIVVNNCSALEVCKETNGDLSVNGGTAPYTWSNWGVTGQSCVGGIEIAGNCLGGNFVDDFGWIDFGNGPTVTPPVGVDSIRVIDNAGTEYFIYDIDTVTSCNGCNATISPAGPFCQNDAAVILNVDTTGGTWSGPGISNSATGEFTPSLSVPVNTITYTLPCGIADTITILTFANATSTDVITSCNPITWLDGNTYSTDNNTATFTIPNGASSGCDSIVTLDFTINSGSNGTDVISSCDPIVWLDGNTYSSDNNSATYTIPNGASNGCDSIVTLDFTINSASNGTDIISSCDPIVWLDGNTYSSDNNSATYTIPNGASNGCDSIVNLDFTRLNTASGTDVRTSCLPITWLDGNTYSNNNNSATFTIPDGASNGCDSVVTLDFTLTNAVNGTDIISSCNSITWLDGNTYSTDNNTATFTISGGASNGCDSLITLNFTKLNAANGVDVITSCSPITWLDGNTYSTDNNSATFTISGGASNGCDSIVTLDFTLTNAVNGTDVISSCNPITWIDGNTYSTDNNTATFTISGGASNGCDSIVTLDFTLTNAVNGTDVISSCNPITWIDGNTYSADNNTATFTISGGASNGCDSVATLNLTITNAVNETDVQTSCGEFTWIDGNTYTSNNNSATFIIPNGASNGCDSIITLNLVVNEPSTIDLGEDTTILSGTSIVLDPVISGAANGDYTWTPSTFLDCDTCVNPTATPEEETLYSVNYINEFGCLSADDILISLQEEDFNCVFPTAFSPNNDNLNDVFRGYCKNVATINLRVFNRWGDLIYSELINDNTSGWDGTYQGKDQEIDAYTFTADIEYTNGEKEIVSGNFTLIR